MELYLIYSTDWHSLLFSLLIGFLLLADTPDSYIEKQRYDGWYNNLAHPDWGSTGAFSLNSIFFYEFSK